MKTRCSTPLASYSAWLPVSWLVCNGGYVMALSCPSSAVSRLPSLCDLLKACSVQKLTCVSRLSDLKGSKNDV